MAKLTKQQWADVRRQWECDQRDGHQWLADELTAKGYDVTRAAIAKAAKRQNWAKGGTEKATHKSVTQNVTLSEKTSRKKVTPATAKPAPEATPETESGGIPEPEWGEVDEPNHGNSKYKQAYNQQAYRLCLLGATDKHLADFFGVSEQTINNWKMAHDDFFESIKVGKMMADANVAESLYHRSIGYSHPHTHVSVIENEVVLTELTKHYPPDTKAAFIWLKNRQPTLWRDKTEIKADINITPIPWDELREITKNAVAEAERKQQELLATRYAALGIKREEHYSD